VNRLSKNTVKKIKHITDILKLHIGYGSKAFLSPFMRDHRIQFDLISSQTWFNQNFRKLLIKRVDAIYMPEVPSLLYIAKQFKKEKQIRFINLREKVFLYTAFSKTKNNFPQRYDQAFQKIKGRETYLKLLSKYIDIKKL
jgi:polar amino acid transport system substrate-binding protein